MDIELPIGIIKGIISGKKKKDNKYEKAKIQRIIINDNDMLQLSLFTDKQVFHYNYSDSVINDKEGEGKIDGKIFNYLINFINDKRKEV